PPDMDKPRLSVFRYRAGTWTVDEAWMKALDPSGQFNPSGSAFPRQLVFTAPDDGWLTAYNTGSADAVLFRLRNGAWTNCAVDRGACGDPNGLLPLTNAQ